MQVKARGPPSEEDSSIGAQLMRLQDPRSGQPLADEFVLPQMSVLFWAGFDTTGNTMAWTLYCISQHPEVNALNSHPKQQAFLMILTTVTVITVTMIEVIVTGLFTTTARV